MTGITNKAAPIGAILLTAALLAAAPAARAADACCPADGAPVTAAADRGGTPAPSTQLPPGHPPMPSGGGQLPPGHPPMNEAAQPEPFTGTLMIRAIQGTKDAGPIGEDEVTVQFVQGGRVVHKLNTRLDKHGVVSLEGVELPAAVVPMVAVKHGGVSHEGKGSLMSAEQPDQIVRVNVYEVADEAPAWEITVRHVMVRTTPAGLSVMEVVKIENPTDRVWRGVTLEGASEPEAAADADAHNGGRATIVFPLPAAATEVQLGKGFHDCCAQIEPGKLIHKMPMLPGASEFQFVYNVPVRDGQAVLDLAAPAKVQKLMVMVPQDGSEVKAEGIEGGDVMPMGKLNLRVYQAESVAAGRKAKLTISGLKATTAAAEPAASLSGAAAEAANGGSRAKAVAGVGAGALLIGGAVFLIKSKKA